MMQCLMESWVRSSGGERFFIHFLTAFEEYSGFFTRCLLTILEENERLTGR